MMVMIIFHLATGFFILFLIRNNRVCNFNINLLNKISDIYQKEISETGKYDDWRYTKFSSVNYGEMLWKFWKPLNSFYRKDFPEKKKQ